MTLLSQESGVQTSIPREGIEIIITGVETWRIATGTRDVTINAQKYIAEPSARAEMLIPRAGEQQITHLRLPAKHAFVARYMRGTHPPRFVAVNVYRQQTSDYEVIWRGKIAAIEFTTTSEAVFSVPSRLLTLLQTRLPQFPVARTCGNLLYDANCQVARASFTVSTTITNVNGTKVTVATMSGNPDQWARKGSILHVPSGERLPIADQTGSVLTLQYPVVGWANSQSVQVFAGCDQLIATCEDKFSNRARFNGSPYLNRETLRSPPGYGTYSSS